MRVLVTGGTGFVGVHLCARLVAEGFDVRVLARPTALLDRLAGLRVQIHPGDVTEADGLDAALDGVQRVFHLAAALKSFTEADMFRVNAGGSRNLARACALRAGDIERLVVVSSVAAVGPSPGGRAPLTEEDPERPVTWYGRSKLAGEKELRSLAAAPTVVLRPPVVYGPYDRELLFFFRAVSRGFLPVLGCRDRFYSLIFVEDLVDSLLRAAAAPAAAGQVFFVAGPEIVSWLEFGALVATTLAVKPALVRAPEIAAVAAGKVADVVAYARGRPSIFSSQKVIEMRQLAWVASPARIQRVLGWTAATPLAEGLARTVRWYRDHGWI